MNENLSNITESIISYAYYSFTPLFVIFLFYYYRRSKQNKSGQPPRPPCLPSLPIVGSLPFIPNLQWSFRTFTNMRSKYGNVFAFYAGSKYMVVLNGHTAIQEGWSKKGKHASTRSNILVETDYTNKKLLGLSFSPYDERYKVNRQISMSILKDFGFGKDHIMESRIQAELVEFIKIVNKLNGRAFNPMESLLLTTQNVIFRLLLNERFDEGDANGKMNRDTIEFFFNALDGVLTLFPIVRFIPKYREILRKAEAILSEFRSFMIDRIHNPRSDETDFCKEYKTRLGERYVEEDLIYIVRDIFSGGFDTSSVQTCWSLILIGNHPHVKERLQKEVASVVPRERLPSLNDRENLPYVEAVILESLRMKTIVPIPAPRLVEDDIEIEGFSISKNSLILANFWSAHMDPKIWSDPDQFRPERFLDGDNNVINKDLVISFSMGKRSCLGEPMARQELFLILATIIQQFDILPPEGQERISYKEVNALLYKPDEFKLRLVSRSN